MTGLATASAGRTTELQDAAIEISRILRDAKVDAPLRPKALAAILAAATQGPIDAQGRAALARLNRQVARALAASRLENAVRRKLIPALRLAGPDFARLGPFLPRIVGVLQGLQLNGKHASDIDFLGIFYEAFLRYGYDNNALGIVFTPRHITRFCVELLGVSASDRVVDIACGTGGFLVAAHEAMQAAPAHGPGRNCAGGIHGCDTNATVWALATLNLLFRSRGKEHSQIELGSCFEPCRRRAMRRRFTRAFLNPPFSQDAEPESDFIDATMEALAPGGRCAVVVKTGIFADDEHRDWRRDFLRQHRLLAVISLPEELFYPTAAPTSILIAEAHVPQPPDAAVLVARIWNDGFEKLKNRRVECSGCELPEVKRAFADFLAGRPERSRLATALTASKLLDGSEWSAQQWLPQPPLAEADLRSRRDEVVKEILRCVTEFPELADSLCDQFGEPWAKLPLLPNGKTAALAEFFRIENGRSAGEKHFSDGTVAYVSSGGNNNSIVRLVDCEPAETFAEGGLTVTAFGHATVQPWPFAARGNGGSSVRVLLPRFRMNFADLAWFATQINAQEWRFFYARMAIKSRIERLVVKSPPRTCQLPYGDIASRVRKFRTCFDDLSRFGDGGVGRL